MEKLHSAVFLCVCIHPCRSALFVVRKVKTFPHHHLQQNRHNQLVLNQNLGGGSLIFRQTPSHPPKPADSFYCSCRAACKVCSVVANFFEMKSFRGMRQICWWRKKTEAPRGAGVVKLTTAAKWVLQESGVGAANCNKWHGQATNITLFGKISFPFCLKPPKRGGEGGKVDATVKMSKQYLHRSWVKIPTALWVGEFFFN